MHKGGLKMKCTLMNKNTEVLSVEYNTSFKIFDKMYKIIDIPNLRDKLVTSS